MTTTEIREKLLTDDAFVLAQIKTICSYYQLKHTVRWAMGREDDETESVAEHVYGMHVLADYFLPFIDPEAKLNHELIRQLITWHDMAEAFVGDMPTNHKTEDHKAAEFAAEASIVTDAPTHLKFTLEQIFSIYSGQEKFEARFVKAIDKIEPMFYLQFLIFKHGTVQYVPPGWPSAETYNTHRQKYVKEFPIILRFDNILHQNIVADNFYPA